VFVKSTADERAAGSQPGEACVSSEFPERALEEGAMHGRHLRPMLWIENILAHRDPTSRCGLLPLTPRMKGLNFLYRSSSFAL